MCHTRQGRTRPGLGCGLGGALGVLVAGKAPTRPQEGGKARVRLTTEKEAIWSWLGVLVKVAHSIVTVGGLPHAGRTFVTNDKAPTTLKIRLTLRKASGGQAINGSSSLVQGTSGGRQPTTVRDRDLQYSHQMWYLSQLRRG
ncbi:hypothetical protein PpBr36_07126 [Pyricularia pennisetigena]|uniref:hypothetical protein n=1 Tax=Pyricularia pennisetigena TaxID=1578925 RepID=UPI001150BFAA|nr:hypothetical protein PpBr36_07126 [Pyricularia pennisetigena]TLS26051.1 hypothetical protein PpBr36_07126 [Pyricularia pennisetigena]